MSISLISVVMAAFTTFFVNSVAFTNQQRTTQVAIQIANSQVDTIRALPASDRVIGHDAISVKTQFDTASNTVSVWNASMVQAVDTKALTANSGLNAALPTGPVTQTINNVVYSTNVYLGTCVITTPMTANATCGLVGGTTSIGYMRAVVAVTWTGARCPSVLVLGVSHLQCSYVTATLLSTIDDPLFNLSQSPPALPILLYVVNPAVNQISAVGDTVSLPATISAASPYTVTMDPLTPLPVGLTLDAATGLISGKPTAVQNSTSVKVILTDGFLRTTSVTFTWTIIPALTATAPGPAPQAGVIGLAIASLTLTASGGTSPYASGGTTPYTWTSTTLPPGLSISTVDSVTSIVGTPTGPAALVPVTLTVTDSKARTATVSFTWKIDYPPFAVAQPLSQISTLGVAATTLALGATPGSGSFTWIVSAATPLPAGLTLTSNTGTSVGSAWTISGTPTALTATGGTSLTLQVTDPMALNPIQKTVTFLWTVVSKPSEPQAVAVVNGDTSVTASWTAPANGAVVSSYTATATLANSVVGSCTAPAATPTCVISGLTNGVVYSLTVTATNINGTGPASVAVNAIPYPALVMSAANGMTLWLDGADPNVMFSNVTSTCAGTLATTTTTGIGCWKDKSGLVNNFVQTGTANQPGVTTAWRGLTSANFADTSDVLNSIKADSQYRTVLVAANVAGTAQFTDLFGQATQDFNVRIGSGTWRKGSDSRFNINDWAINTGTTPLNWANGAQAVNVNSPMAVITSDQADSLKTFAASVSNTFMSRGVVGQVGDVITFNKVLTTAERRAVEEYLANKWAIPITPSAPQTVAAANVNNVLSVAWAAPATGTPTSYTATVVPAPGAGASSTCATTTALNCKITGLTNGLTYTVTVAATNAVGIGPSSIAVSAAPLLSAANGMTLWLDGADQTTLLATCTGAATTTAIGCWKDKSGLGNNFAQGTAGNQPIVSTWNGRNALNFANTTVVLNSVKAAVAYQTVFVAANVTTTTGYDYLFGNANMDHSNVRLTGVSRGTVDGNDWSGNTGSLPLNWTNGTQGKSAVFPGTSPLAVITSDQSATVNNYSASVSNSGQFGGAYRGVVGQVGEVIAFNGILTTTQRRAVEEYLSSKWGVTLAGQAPTTPQAPTSVTGVSPSAGNVTVSWVAPTADLGVAAISQYTVTSLPDSRTCNPTPLTLTCAFTGLTTGTAYTFTVSATNSIGTGPASVSSTQVTP